MPEMKQPQMVFLPEGSQRIKGREAQRINILIAKAIAQAVKSTLGPKGMDKMLVDELGEVTITNDGATILKEMSIDHPAGKMMVDLAKTQDEAVGDGTTTTVVLAGELLKEAEKLMDEDIHPTVIINGFRIAQSESQKILDSIATKVDVNDKKILKEIAYTTMTGKSSEARDYLTDMIVDAVLQIVEKEGEKTKIDSENIKIEKKTGAAMHDTQLIKGIVIDKERVSSSMPTSIKNAKIALIDSALEIKEPETDTKVEISSPEQLEAFLEKEEQMLRKMVKSIKDTGANVVFTQKGIDDLASHFLAKEGILAVRRVKNSDLNKLSKATGAKIVSRIEDLAKSDLGEAGLVSEKKIAGENMVFVEDCKNPKAVTILLRGSTQHVLDEAERAIIDTFGTLGATIEDAKVVAGGGSTETELSLRLEEHAKTIGGREQLAVQAFAKALEIIPKTLAESAGMNPIDAIVSLKVQHKNNPDKKGANFGIDVYSGKIADLMQKRVIEPLKIKKQAIASATEVVETILRIDDIIAASGSSKEPGPRSPGDFESED